VDYNQFKSALVAIPRDFKVQLIPRPDSAKGGRIEQCLAEAQERTKSYYVE
jgi:phenylacetate 2-hydroxylase